VRERSAALAAALLLLAGCQGEAAQSKNAAPTPTQSISPTRAPTPLRAGERFLTLAMPAAYTPKAPSYGTDDYRCFLLDPGLKASAYVTGVDVLPGNPDVVHHVILFQVPPDQVAGAEAVDARTPGEGWTCFGGTGLSGEVGADLNKAPWIGAWAPGGGERVMAGDIGIPLAPGTRVIMQVHYNLLAGDSPDTSSARLRIADGNKPLKPLDTMLLVAPVELPCRPGHDSGALCDRDKAVFDVAGRFGDQASYTVAGLQLICGGSPAKPEAGPVQHCDRTVREGGTIRAIAGHMHLLGRRISIELNPGTEKARTLLDLHPWNFDDQGSVPVTPPAKVRPGDTLRVTCRHTQRMRDLLPELQGIPARG
jgi:hypothetical protein